MFVPRTTRLTGGSSGGAQVLSRHSVNSAISNNTNWGEENHDRGVDVENCELQRPIASDAQENPVSPVKFVHKWLETHLPWDESSAQLRRKLSAATVKNHRQQRFIPDSKLREIVATETVRMELEKSNYSNVLRIRTSPVTIEDVSQYQKILAILYLIKLPSRIRKFVKYGVCDKHLPLIKCESSKKKGSSYLRSAHDCTAPTIRFKRDYSDDFLENQWRVLAPIFPGSSGDSIVHSSAMPGSFLPFLSHDRVRTQGGYSDVFKTEIPPDHHKFGNSNVSCIIPICLGRIILM